MLVSLHIPKTGGTSFKKSLKAYFGQYFRAQYDNPINTPIFRRKLKALSRCIYYAGHRNSIFKEIECIHGHFLPVKYLLLGPKKEVKFVTWLRDPVKRLGSHYYFWKRSYNPEESLTLHRKVVTEKWSFERFCFAPEFRNYYTQYFWGFPFSRFDFIGIMEYYDEDFDFFAKKYLRGSSLRYKENANTRKNQNPYIRDRKLKQEIEAFHKKDMTLYCKALEKRKNRSF